MGKIKVLFAAENGDDDLIDYDNEEVKAFIEMRKKQKEDSDKCKKFVEIMYDDIIKDEAESVIRRFFNGEVYYVNGKLDKLKSNYEELCSTIGESAIETIIECQHLDISDKEYAELVSYASNLAISKFDYVKEDFLKLARKRLGE